MLCDGSAVPVQMGQFIKYELLVHVALTMDLIEDMFVLGQQWPLKMCQLRQR